jgi:hypothetical protein
MTTNMPARTGKSPWRRARFTVLVAAATAIVGMAALPALTASASPAHPGTAVVARSAAPTVNGLYTVYFSWRCTSRYSTAPVTFYPNGTFTSPGPDEDGTWAQVNGSLFFEFNAPSRTVYSGTVDGNGGSGASSTFAGMDGCWYMTKNGTTSTVQPAARHGQPAGLLAGDR